jgi:hypothetical protein
MLTDKNLRNWYLSYNRRYFHEELPPNLPVYFGACGKKNLGVTWFDETGAVTEIIMSTWLRESGRCTKIFLLHELLHLYVGNKERSYHGPIWRRERKRLLDSGAYTPLL